MGTRIAALLTDVPGMTLVAALERAGSPALGREIAGVKVTAELGKSRPDVLIDFSEASATQSRLVSWGQGGFALVVGTTGLSEATRATLAVLSRKVPVLVAPNTSLGANAVFALAEAAARMMPSSWDAAIVETHHVHKKDAPSGTALALASAFERGGGRRPPMHSLRLADVVGEHELVLAGPGERIRISHSAVSRDAFARGALEAARFVASARPGLYGMSDVLKARRPSPAA